MGYVTNLQDYQHIVDVAVSCSKREGLPLNIVEAMMSGVPVVATINRGHRELIHEAETGFLVEYNKSQDMAKRVVELLKDENLRQEKKKNALVNIKKYGYSNVKEELTKIYFNS